MLPTHWGAIAFTSAPCGCALPGGQGCCTFPSPFGPRPPIPTPKSPNQKRCPLSPLDLARFIRERADDGDSNGTIAKRLGMDLTSIAHHLALLELPPELDQVLKTGRCTSPRTLYELSKLHDEQPDRIHALMTGEGEITRSAVAALRAASVSGGAPDAAVEKRSRSLIEQANAACTRLEMLVIRVKQSEPAQARPELAALRRRIADLADRLA